MTQPRAQRPVPPRSCPSVFLAAAVSALLASGCVTSGTAHPDDPLEGYNRAMFSFNETVDKAVMKPLAQGYDYVAPTPVKVGVGNFFGNIADVWISANNLLQGKVKDALSDVGRVLVNSTLGIAGLFDVATDMGLDKHDEDFGQTLGKWGVGEGGYFVVPILGPRTVRDALALPVDFKADPVNWLEDVATRNVLFGLRAVHDRYTFLGVEKTLDEGTLDKYTYSRDYYLQQRRYRVFDGKPPKRADDEAFLMEPAAESELVSLIEPRNETQAQGARPE